MKGLDDGPDGLNDAAFNRALGGGRKGRRRRRTVDAATSTPDLALAPPNQAPDPISRELARQDLETRIVDLARRWYRYGNEAELAAAVQELESLLKRESEGT